jgi:hypothetical protein
VPIEAGKNELIGSVDAGSDGFDTYVVFNPRDSFKVGTTSDKPISNSVAQILSGPVVYEVPAAPVIWLAVCSGCYLTSVTNHKIVPIHLAVPPGRVPAGEFVNRASWTNLPGDFGIPESLSYFEDEIVRLRADGHTERYKLDPPFDKGYVTASYEVLDVTNWQGSKLPLDFRFQTYAPDYSDPKVANVKMQMLWQGRVTNITSNSESAKGEAMDFIPPLSGNAVIADRRFGTEGLPLVTYVTNNWPSKENVRTSTKYALWKQGAQYSQIGVPKPGRQHHRLLWVLLLCSGGTGAVLWRMYRRVNDSQK